MAGPFLSKRPGYHKETGAQRIISAVGAGSCPTVPSAQIPKQITRGESVLTCPRRAFHVSIRLHFDSTRRGRARDLPGFLLVQLDELLARMDIALGIEVLYMEARRAL